MAAPKPYDNTARLDGSEKGDRAKQYTLDGEACFCEDFGKVLGAVKMPDPQVSGMAAALLGAIVGAVFSALGTYLLNARRHRLDTKRRIVGEIGSLTDRYVAELIELHAATSTSDVAQVASKRAAAYRLRGAGGALEFEIGNYFTDRRASATFHKVLDRWEVALNWILSGDCKSANDAQLAFDWIYQQSAIAIEHAGREAAVPLRAKGGIKFLGFRFGKEKREFIRDLSFEDGPPPWKFTLTYEFRDQPFTPEELKTATAAHTAMVGGMRCKTHNRPAQVRMHGLRSNFSIEVGACCEEFSQRVYEGLSGRPLPSEKGV